jgi:hypothetical protein
MPHQPQAPFAPLRLGTMCNCSFCQLQLLCWPCMPSWTAMQGCHKYALYTHKTCMSGPAHPLRVCGRKSLGTIESPDRQPSPGQRPPRAWPCQGLCQATLIQFLELGCWQPRRPHTAPCLSFMGMGSFGLGSRLLLGLGWVDRSSGLTGPEYGPFCHLNPAPKPPHLRD